MLRYLIDLGPTKNFKHVMDSNLPVLYKLLSWLSDSMCCIKACTGILAYLRTFGYLPCSLSIVHNVLFLYILLCNSEESI